MIAWRREGVLTPLEVAVDEKLPVMVWIYGGAFAGGVLEWARPASCARAAGAGPADEVARRFRRPRARCAQSPGTGTLGSGRRPSSAGSPIHSFSRATASAPR